MAAQHVDFELLLMFAGNKARISPFVLLLTRGMACVTILDGRGSTHVAGPLVLREVLHLITDSYSTGAELLGVRALECVIYAHSIWHVDKWSCIKTCSRVLTLQRIPTHSAGTRSTSLLHRQGSWHHGA